MDVEIRAFLASLEAQPSYTKSTRLAYGSDLHIFRDFLISSLHRPPALADITPNLLELFFTQEQEKGLKPNTLLRRKAAIQRFEQFLMQESKLESSLLGADLAFIGESDNGEEESTTIRCLTPEEVSCLKAYLSKSRRPVTQRDRSILAFLLETGLSVSALISLSLPELDMSTRRFHLTLGPGRECWLPLGNSFDSLETYLLEARPELNPGPGESALFISQLGARMSRQSIWQVLRNTAKGAGLGFSLSPRIVRHTAALSLFRSGRPSSEIQYLLGHSNPLSTQALIHRLEDALISPGQPQLLSKEF